MSTNISLSTHSAGCDKSVNCELYETLAFLIQIKCDPVITRLIDHSHKSHNAPVPHPTMHHSERKYAHFCSEWCIVGYGAGALWDVWIWSIAQCTCLISHSAPFRTEKVHISVLNGALWDIGQVHCGICEFNLLSPKYPWRVSDCSSIRVRRLKSAQSQTKSLDNLICPVTTQNFAQNFNSQKIIKISSHPVSDTLWIPISNLKSQCLHSIKVKRLIPSRYDGWSYACKGYDFHCLRGLPLSNPLTWLRHQMETFPALLAFCAGNSPVTDEFPAQRSVTRSFDVFFDLRLNKRISKQSWGWWFEASSHPLWRQCNAEPSQTSFCSLCCVLYPSVHHRP